MTTSTAASTYVDIAQELRITLRALIETTEPALLASNMQCLQDLLSALPLAADEAQLAANRLSNAHNYLARREPHVARFELKQLALHLAKQLTLA